MKRSLAERWLQPSRKVHTWSGLALALLIVVEAVTGFFLLNKGALSAIDRTTVSTSALPRHYGDAVDEVSSLEVLAVDPRDPRHVLDGSKGGLLESRDGGSSFAEAAAVGHIKAIHFDDSGALWIGGPKGLYRCDASLRCDSRSKMDVRSIARTDSGALLVASKRGLYRSSDGTTFSLLPSAATSNAVPLGKVLGDLHTGKFFDGRLDLAYDALAIALLVFVGTGLHLWLTPALLRRRKARARAVAPPRPSTTTATP